MKTLAKIQPAIAVASFVAAVCFGIAGFVVPPSGQVHDSVLYLVAQFLLLTASFFGVGAVFRRSDRFHSPPTRHNDEEEEQ